MVRIVFILLLIVGVLVTPISQVMADPGITFDFVVAVPPEQQDAIARALAHHGVHTPMTVTSLQLDPKNEWFHAVLVPSSLLESGWDDTISGSNLVDVLGRRDIDEWDAWVHTNPMLPPLADLTPEEWAMLKQDLAEPAGYMPSVELRFPWTENQAWLRTQGWHPTDSLDFAPKWSSNLAVSAAVLAAGEGTLSVVCNDKQQINVRISHPDGTTTGYTHLDSASFRYDLAGRYVVRGQHLGRLYNTGGSYATTCGRGTGMHLHFSVSHRDLLMNNIHLNEIAATSQWYTSANPRIDDAKSAGTFTADVHTAGAQAFTMQRWATRQGGFWSAQRWLVGDFTGDGRQDLLKLWDDNGAMSADVHAATSNGFTMKRWSTRQGGFWDAQRWFVGDFNGDGREDLAKYWNDRGSLTLDVHVSNGTSFTMQRWATQQGGLWSAQKWFVGDFTGDGRQDLLKLWNDGGAMTADVHVSTGTAFAIQRWATRQGGFWDAQRWLVGDFTGDGRQDLLKLWNDAGAMTVDVHVSTGTAFTIQRWATRQGGFWDAQRWLVGDFTGDGRQDLLKLWNDAGAMTVDVHASTGTAFTMQRWATRQGGFWNSQNWIVGDFNGDRRSDLAKYWNDGGAMTIDVHPSSGKSFGMQRWATRQGGIWAGQTWMLGDFNADRRTDLTKIWRDSVARTALVADQGGILASSEVHLHVLPETFTTPTTVTVTLMYEEVPNIPDGLIGLNTRYELVATEQASGTPTVPTQPMTLTVAYDADDVMLLNEESLALYRWNGVEWLLEPSSSVDSEANTITITTHQQGPWAVFSAQTYKHYLPLIVR